MAGVWLMTRGLPLLPSPWMRRAGGANEGGFPEESWVAESDFRVRMESIPEGEALPTSV